MPAVGSIKGLLPGSLGLVILLLPLIQVWGETEPSVGDPPYCYHHGCCHVHAQAGDYVNPLETAHLSAYDVKAYDLDLEVSNLNTRLEGRAVVVMEMLRDCDTLVLELRDHLEVSKVALSLYPSAYPDKGAADLDFEHSGDALYIDPGTTALKGQVLQLAVFYGGDAGSSSGFFSGYTQRKDPIYGFEVSYTLSEPHNARDWFPVKQVLFDKMDSLSMAFSCDEGLLVASNGLLVSNTVTAGKRRMHWKSSYPMVYYLASLSVANYRDFSYMAPLSEPGDSVLVQNYIYDTDQVLTDQESDIKACGSIIAYFSKLFGDYPFALEKYGHALAPIGGGMEHQTMSTMANFNFFLVAHELAHQWFGDLVTCGNWQDIWINEGFASYLEFVAAQGLLDEDAAGAWMENARSIAFSAHEGSVYVPEEEVENESRLFSYALSYKKGSILLHMIRFILDDDDLFFWIMEDYLTAYAFSGATAMEFKAILEAGSSMDFTAFFDQWYFGEGYPRFDLSWEQVGDSLRLVSRQSTTAPSVTPLFELPFEVEVYYVGGSRERFRVDQNEEEQSFLLPVRGIVDAISFDPDSRILATGSATEIWAESKPYRFGPNPAGHSLNIRFFSGGTEGSLRFCSLDGKEVMYMDELINPMEINLEGLRSGPYLMEITRGSTRYLEQIVVLNN